jgi:DeoR/GlpR family transcriptional regulator of sugar metabolism
MALRYGSAPERRGRILQLVQEQGFCSTSELVAALGVSDMTVRRDAQRLAEEDSVRIVHGGVSVLPPSALKGSGDFTLRTVARADAKRAIGRQAAELVEPGTVIGLDAGTTLIEVARALPSQTTFTVVTNSAPIIAELLTQYSVRVIVLGGELHHETQSFAGASVLAELAQLHIGTLFLAASGVSKRGIFCGNDFDAVTKRALIAASDRVVLVVDSSKFETSAMVRICNFDAIDEIVVDDGIRPAEEQLLRAADVAVTKTPVALARER